MPRTDHIELSAIEDLVTRILPRSAHSAVERVEEGVSTAVYKVQRAGKICYARVLPEEGASFAPEAGVHELLRQRGVKVPEVIYVDACDIVLGRSVMVTTEIAGQHVGHCRDERDVRRVLVEAGRDLAAINSVPVAGFGWIRRHDGEADHLAGEHRGYREFARDPLEDDLALLGAHTLDPHDVAAIREAIERHDSLLDVVAGFVATGSSVTEAVTSRNLRKACPGCLLRAPNDNISGHTGDGFRTALDDIRRLFQVAYRYAEACYGSTDPALFQR